MEKTYFTLTQANSLINFLTEILNEIHDVKQEIGDLILDMEKDGLVFQEIFQKKDLSAQEQEYRAALEELGDTVNNLIYEITDKGPVLKDIEKGLIDFYSKIDGNDVFLCWQKGEAEISYWHGINEGFGGRRSLFVRSVLESVDVVH